MRFNGQLFFSLYSISPVLVITDYLFFDEKGHFQKKDPFIWICVPLAYIIYVYTYSALGGVFYSVGGSSQFAYFFLDYVEIGIKGVAKWTTLFALAIFGVSYLLVIFDGWRSKK